MLALLVVVVSAVTWRPSPAPAALAQCSSGRGSKHASLICWSARARPLRPTPSRRFPRSTWLHLFAAVVGDVDGVEVPFVIYADPTGAVGTAINRPRLIAGRRPDASVVEEIVLSEPTADALALGPGDRLHFRPLPPEETGHGEGDAEIPTPLDLVVVGVTRDLDDALAPSGERAYGSPAFPRAMGQGLEQVGNHLVRLHPGVDVAAFEARVRAALPDVDVSVQDLNGELGKLDEALDVLRIGLLVLGVVAGLAGTVVLALLIDRQLQVGAPTLATLRALGCGRAVLALAGGAPAVPVLVAGILVGCVLAVLCSPLASFGLAERLDPDVGVRTDVPVIVGGAMLLAAFVVIAAFAAGWRWAGAPAAPHANRSGRAARRIPAIALPVACAVGGRLALESETGRRLRPAVITAAMGIAGIAAAVVLSASLDRTVDAPDRYGQAWQAFIEYPPGPTPEAKEVFAGTSEVAAVAELLTGDVTFGQGAIPALALRPVVGEMGLRVLEGRAPVAADEIVLGSATADMLGVDVGDELTAMGSAESKVRVVGRAVFPQLGVAQISEGAWLTPTGHDKYTLGLDHPELVLTWRENTDQVAATTRLESALPGLRLHHNEPPIAIENLARTAWVPWALGVLLAALGVVRSSTPY